MHLTKKYRIIWNVDTLEVEEDPSRDNSGTTTIIVPNIHFNYFESDIYQDILDKIDEENLILP